MEGTPFLGCCQSFLDNESLCLGYHRCMSIDSERQQTWFLYEAILRHAQPLGRLLHILDASLPSQLRRHVLCSSETILCIKLQDMLTFMVRVLFNVYH